MASKRKSTSLKRSVPSTILMCGAGAGSMQCFSHFRKTHVMNASPVMGLKAVHYESRYAPDMKRAERRLTFYFNRNLATLATNGGVVSFTVPTSVNQLTSVSASARGQSLQTDVMRRGSRSEIHVHLPATDLLAKEVTLSFNSPSMRLVSGRNVVFLADFLIFDMAVKNLDVRSIFSAGWTSQRGLPETRRIGKNTWSVNAKSLRPCEQQLLCMGAHRN